MPGVQPGLKRKASTAPGEKQPVKLKKQSTSTTIDRAIPTLKQRTSKLKPSAVTKLNKGLSVARKKAGKSKDNTTLPPLPRFPTLVPTQPADKTKTDFVFNVTPTSSLKRAPTIATSVENASSEQKSSDAVELRKCATTIMTPKSSVEHSGSKVSDIGKTVEKLSSGSYVGRIMNFDGDDTSLPSLQSMAVYEGPSKKTSSTPFTWDLTETDTDTSPVRKSLYDVNAVLNLLDQDNSPTKQSIGGDSTDEEDNNAPPLLQAEVFEATSSGEDFDEDTGVPTLTCMGSPSKSPAKSPRKMTGGPREIVFSFDTTGSMYNYMEEARDRMRELLNRVQEDMPGIRLAFVAHGDYYDLANDRYLIKWIDFGASVDEVDEFFENLPITHGGDADECYELVLRKVRESLSWSPGSQRSLVMIGDSDPHEPGYTFNDFVNDIDWRQETKLLNDMGVRIYALQVGYTSNFYKQIAHMTGGAHLRIENTEFTYDTLMAICLREGSLRHLKGYENEVRSAAKKSGNNGGVLDLELESLFSSLKNIADNKSLKQRDRENKIKARIMEMNSTKTPISSLKRPPEKAESNIEEKKAKISTEPTPQSPVKLSSSKVGRPKTKEMTKIKDKTKVKMEKKLSIEKMKKVSKVKTPMTKKMSSKISKKTPSEGGHTKKKTERSPTQKKIKDAKINKGKQMKESKVAKLKKSPGRPPKALNKSKLAVKPGKNTKKVTKSKVSPKQKDANKSSIKTVTKSKAAMKGKTSGKSGPVSKLKKSLKSQPVSKSKAASKLKNPKISTKAKVTDKSKTTVSKKVVVKGKTVTKKGKVVSTKLGLKKIESKGKMSKLKLAIKEKKKQTNAHSRKKINVKDKMKTKTAKADKAIKSRQTKSAPLKKGKTALAQQKLKKNQGKKARKDIEKTKKVTVKQATKKKPLEKSQTKTKTQKKTENKSTPKKLTAKGSLKKKSAVNSAATKKMAAKISLKKKPALSTPPKKSAAKTPPKGKSTPLKKSTAVLSPSKKTVTKPTPPKIKKEKSIEQKAVKPVTTPKKGLKTEPRENISSSKFSTGPLSNMRWSQWTPIISPTAGDSQWAKSKSWCSGQCNEGIFKGESKTQALYETAVVPPGSTNKYPVFYITQTGFPKFSVWECFRTASVQKETERVIKAKGSIYVRRGVIAGRAKDSLNKAEEYIKENFNYAWVKGSNRKSDVKKEGFLVSKGTV